MADNNTGLFLAYANEPCQPYVALQHVVVIPGAKLKPKEHLPSGSYLIIRILGKENMAEANQKRDVSFLPSLR